MMYECYNCGCRFEEPKVTYETHGLEYPPFQKIYVCPECGVDDMGEVEEDDEGTL